MGGGKMEGNSEAPKDVAVISCYSELDSGSWLRF